jgi:hypothetical protein
MPSPHPHKKSVCGGEEEKNKKIKAWERTLINKFKDFFSSHWPPVS